MSQIKKMVLATLIVGLVVGSLLSWANPAMAEPEYKWRFQSLYRPGLAYDTMSKALAERIELMSGGRIKITVFPGGALAPAKEIHRALARGQFEMATGAGAYAAGSMPEGYLEFALPGGPRNLEEYLMFFYNFGFNEIIQEAYNEMGIHYLGPNPGGWRNIISKKPIRSVADLKGLKIRATGIDAKWLEKLGASPMFLPVGEIYTGLALGTIDASLYGGPSHQWDGKLMEVAKYEILPNVELSCSNTMINLKLWKSLPDDIKTIIQTATTYTAVTRYFINEKITQERLEKMQADYDVKVIVLPEADVAKMRSAGMQALREAGKKSERYAKGMKQLDEAMKFYLWRYDANY